MALSGEGGDELFGGYNYYAGHALARRLAPAAWALRPLVERLPTSTDKASSLDWRAKRFVRAARMSPLERHYAWKSVFTPEERGALVHPDRRAVVDPLEILRTHYSETEGADELSRLMGLDLGLFIVDDMLVKTDRASMAHSLEARVPILDPVVAELALALPSKLKVRGLAKKRLLRKAVAPLLPREILEGKKQRLRAPDRHVAAQRAAADDAGRPVAGECSTAGLLPARGRHPAARRPRRTARRQQPEDLGAC